jgi:hypothetical protein
MSGMALTTETAATFISLIARMSEVVGLRETVESSAIDTDHDVYVSRALWNHLFSKRRAFSNLGNISGGDLIRVIGYEPDLVNQPHWCYI